MITTKRDLQEYMRRDMKFFRTLRRKDRFYCWLLRDPAYFIDKYIRLLRREEYHANKNRTIFSAAACFWFLARKNALGNKLGFKIPETALAQGLPYITTGRLLSMKAPGLVPTAASTAVTASATMAKLIWSPTSAIIWIWGSVQKSSEMLP